MTFAKLSLRLFGLGVALLLSPGWQAYSSRNYLPKSPVRSDSNAQALDSARKARLVETHGTLPLAFEVNRGRAGKRAKFLSRGQGYALFLTQTEAVLSLRKSSPQTRAADQPPGSRLRQERTVGVVFRMVLLGANPYAQITATNKLAGRSNYFIGNDPRKWRTNVPTYGSVQVRDIYPGVDLVYYGHQGQMEEDFVVAPGADPRAIAFKVRGAENVLINSEGELLLRASAGEVHLRKPVIYQELAGVRHEIFGGYALRGRNRVAFNVGEYDASQPLVIDPIIAYSTYLGGSSGDSGSSIAVDGGGNVYVTGTTESSNFPTTPGAFQTSFGGSSDAFVTKINAAGSAVVYSTFLGGSSGDSGSSIAVDSGGNVYVTGTTGSSNFPTTPGAFQTSFGGTMADSTNAFVSKLNATGSSLLYSTYVGGCCLDSASSIAVGVGGNAFVTGQAASFNFPFTSGALATCHDGPGAFVSELNAAGSALMYSACLGGNSAAVGFGIALDSGGNAYVTGTTFATDFPTTPGAFQRCNGNKNVFASKLNAAGSGFVYSTCITGGSDNIGRSIAVDSAGNAYVTGTTISTDFPTTPGAFQTTPGSIPVLGGHTLKDADGFVSKLNATGSALVYSTYLGGSSGAGGSGIVVDSQGNLYVTGSTGSSDFPTTLGAFQTSFGGSSDAFVTRLNTAGSALVYSTFLGGSGNDGASAIAVDGGGNVYVTGTTESSNFPTTPGAFQTSFGGSSDAFVTKIAAIPVARVSPSGLNFNNQLVGTTGMLPVTLTNVGLAPLTVTNVSTSGSPFAVTTNCVAASPLRPTAACTETATFAPTVIGPASGLLIFTDNSDAVPGSTQNVNLSGIGVDFAISASPGSEIIPSGHDATYTITIAPLGGFTGAVSLTCSGGPPNSKCSIVPASVTLTGSSVSTATAIITLLPPKNVDHGTFTITFGGGSGGITRATQVTLTVK